VVHSLPALVNGITKVNGTIKVNGSKMARARERRRVGHRTGRSHPQLSALDWMVAKGCWLLEREEHRTGRSHPQLSVLDWMVAKGSWLLEREEHRTGRSHPQLSVLDGGPFTLKGSVCLAIAVRNSPSLQHHVSVSLDLERETSHILQCCVTSSVW
jgi:hypothetical protein